MKNNYLLKISGICGILPLITTIVTLFIAVQNEPWFSWTEHAISDLGRSTVESHVLFNNGIILTGVLLFLFSLGMAKIIMGSRPGEKVGPIMFALSSLFLIGIGLVPLPNPNHIYVSGLFFIGFPLGFLFMGRMILKKQSIFLQRMGIFAILIAVLAIFSAFLFVFLPGEAIPEMLIVSPGFLWCAIFGIKMTIGYDFK